MPTQREGERFELGRFPYYFGLDRKLNVVCFCRSCIDSSQPYALAFAFLRAAQYFFIRSDTALRAAADMPRRLRRPPAVAPAFRAPREKRSGNARRMDASSF